MDKVQILTTCRVCDGQAYIPTNEVMTARDGHSYIRHRACYTCQGSGKEARWIDLREFAKLLAETAFEKPDA